MGFATVEYSHVAGTDVDDEDCTIQWYARAKICCIDLRCLSRYNALLGLVHSPRHGTWHHDAWTMGRSIANEVECHTPPRVDSKLNDRNIGLDWVCLPGFPMGMWGWQGMCFDCI